MRKRQTIDANDEPLAPCAPDSRLPTPHCFRICLAAILLALSACAAPQRNELTQGEKALGAAENASNGDSSLEAAQLRASQFEQVVHDAEAVLAAGDPTLAAEAYYLRGRALEDRPKFDASALTRDLTAAGRDYQNALNLNPSRPLEARLHTQLGNLAYHRDDYATALTEWTKALEQLDRPEWRMWVLYYMGSSQQRLGRFADADRTFARLLQDYPNSEPARLAGQIAGTHAFYVQVGVYRQASDIDRASAAIRDAGSVPVLLARKDATVVRTADIPSYAQAMAVRNALGPRYADAKIMP